MLALVMLAGSLACRRDATNDAEPVKVAALALTSTKPIAPLSAQVPVDAQQVFTTGFGKGALWSVSNSAIASVSADGVVTGLKAGTTKVVVTAGGAQSASASLMITSVKLTAIDVAEAKRVRGTTQGTVPFAATGVFANNTKFPLADSAIVWTTSNAAIATISPVGQLTPIAPGRVTVKATDIASGISGQVSFTVSGAPVSRVEVVPATLSLPLGFQATFTDAIVLKGGAVDKHPDTVIWSVSDPMIATITDAGVVTALQIGRATVWGTERSSGVVGSATLEVTADQSVEIQVTCVKKSVGGVCSVPADGSLTVKAVATEITNTRRRSPLSWTPVWTSSDTTIATVSSTQQPTCTPLQLKAHSGSCSQPPPGEVVGVSPGTVTITATDPASGLGDSVTVTVGKPLPLVRIQVDPVLPAATPRAKKSAAITVPVGADRAYTATAFYGRNKKSIAFKVDVTDRAVWTTANSTVATVSNARDNEGLLTGIAAGNTTVQAVFGGQNDSAKVKVAALPLRSIEISPQTSSLPAGNGEQLTATGIYTSATTKAGKTSLLKFDITSHVSWASNNASVTVSNAAGVEGNAQAQQAGTAVITATDVAGGMTGTAWITVTPAVLTALTISPRSAQLTPGDTSSFQADGTFSDRSHREMTSKVTWSSTARAVASVANNLQSVGLVTARSLGHAEIGAFDPTTGVSAADVPVDVVARTLIGLTVSPATATIPDGLTQPFTASGTYNNGMTRDLTGAVIWSVASGSATISNAVGGAGLATSQGAGTSSIQAVEPATGLQATATLTVTPAQLLSIAITPPSASLVPGLTQQFTATGTYTDGTVQDLTAVVVWDSSTPGVFAVSNGGGSEGLGTGLAAGLSSVSAVDPTTGLTGTATVTVTSAALVSLAVSPANLSIGGFQPQQFTATGTFSDGSNADLTSSVIWQSTIGEVFTFSTDPASNGLGRSGNAGTSTISATDPATGIDGQTQITVAEGETFPVTLRLTPPQECCFRCGDPYTIIVTDMDAAGNVIDTVSVASTDVATAGSVTVTLPTALPNGAAYTVDVETDSPVYTCSVASDGSTEISGVVSGPVSLAPNCFRNNC